MSATIDHESPPLPAAADASDSLPYDPIAPLLHEVRHALQQLLASGTEHRIDLTSLPLSPHHLEHLRETLGEGEVQAQVSALGPTEVRESAVPGVWFVTYHSPEAQRLALHLEIAAVPQILRTPAEDLEDALARLDARQTGTPGPRNDRSDLHEEGLA